MSKAEKLLEKARNNHSGISFKEFETLLSQSKWMFDHQSGSHRVWYSPKRSRLPVQPNKDGKAKGYQVKQFIERYDIEGQEDG
jgi:predicted RNA binding protein YcfA (HicA-like mRNA interferase family)